MCNSRYYLCVSKLFLLHNLFNLATDGLGNTFAILRIALIEVIDLQVLNALLNLTQTTRDISKQPLLRIRRHQTEQVPRLRVVVAIMLAVIEPSHGRRAVSRGTLNILRILRRSAKAVRLVVRPIAAVVPKAH